MRTRTLAAGLGAALLALAPLSAAAETLDNDDYTAYGSPDQLAGHLMDAHGYTDVVCDKETHVNAETYTLEVENAIALRIQGNVNGKQLWLDPVVGKEYVAPADADNAKINWVIVCTGVAPTDDDGSEQTESPEPTDDGTEQTESPEPTDDGTGQTESPEPTDDGTDQTESPEPTEDDDQQTGPVVETDGPSQRPVNGALILGAGALAAGAGALVLGRAASRR